MKTISLVKFNKYIAPVYESIGDGKNRLIAGTGVWEKDFPNTGKFLQWAAAFEEFESGPGNYTVALVEVAGGTVESVLPANIKFIR